MAKRILIGLTGYKGSGKTEVAKFLHSEYFFYRINFKDALIEEMKEKLPDTLSAIAKVYSTTIPELFQTKPMIMRELMQNYGTEVRRNDDPMYWIKQWEEHIKDLPLEEDLIVCDDVRFLNEADAIKRYNGKIIRVVNLSQDEEPKHQSETEQRCIDADYTLYSTSGKLLALFDQMNTILVEKLTK